MKNFIKQNWFKFAPIIIVITIILTYFYGSIIYSKILGKEKQYNIGKLCVVSLEKCDNTYFQDYLNKISTLISNDRTFFSSIIIRNDRIGYSGNCPCPYNSDSRGHSCGGRSSYSKHGNISYCYDSDVSNSQIEEKRNSMINDAKQQLNIAERQVIGVYNVKYTLIIIEIILYISFLYYKKVLKL